MHSQDLPAPQWSHSAYPLWTWHWHDREHGCAGCCILMYYTAERGAHYAERDIIPLYPCCTSRRRGILHRTLLRSDLNMAVQDAAYSCITLLREEHTMLRETSFRYIPAALPGEEGYYTGLYSDQI